MTRPKGKLIALIAIFAAIGLVTASGAFTSVQADRTVTVNVAGDASALLQLEPGQNPDYADASSGGGELSIDISSSNSNIQSGAEGVNENAVTWINQSFNITNQGTQSVSVTVTKLNDSADVRGGWVKFYNHTDDVRLDNGTNAPGVTLSPGETAEVSIKIDVPDTGSGSSFSTQTILNEIRINADATSPP